MQKITGHCACGAVSFSAEGEMDGIVSCHCKLCQRIHGNYNPMVVVNKDDFTFTNEAGLAWFASSVEARRGFCNVCGSALFKEQIQGPKILVAVGSLDDTSEWKNVKNVYTENAGEYYEMPSGE